MGKNLVVTTINQDSSLEEKIVSEYPNKPRDKKEESSEIQLTQLYQDWSEKQEYFHLGNSHFDLNY